MSMQANGGSAEEEEEDEEEAEEEEEDEDMGGRGSPVVVRAPKRASMPDTAAQLNYCPHKPPPL